MKGNKNAYQEFLDSYKECVVKLIEKGYCQEFEAGDDEKEMRFLWEQIRQGCVNIMVSSINLIY